MILIITHELDYSSYRVMEWLDNFNVEYIQIDHKTPITILDVTISNSGNIFLFKIRNQIISGNQIKKIWYRRSFITVDHFNFESSLNFEFDNSINNQLQEERKEIIAYLWEFFKTKSLNKESDNNLNKFIVLQKSVQYGIKIPDTIITSSKDQLISFKRKHGNIITKNCNPGLLMGYEDTLFTGFTAEVTNDMINKLADNFSPSLYQEMIEKSFELRIFYMDGQFYTSAIFSQSDEKTKTDFRNYNNEIPNRTPPYKLPKFLEKKLTELMTDINLNSGSIDLLVNKKGEYIFLEVNPVGQFSQVSFPCNYNLEKEIAKYLAS